MKDHYVSYEQAVKLKELGFEGNGLKNHIYQGYYKFPNGCISPIKQDSDGILVQFRKKDAEKIPAPRLDQAQAWIRDCKGIGVGPFASIPDKMWAYRLYHTKGEKFGMTLVISNKSVIVYEFNSYESALSAGISKALELLGKEEKDDRP